MELTTQADLEGVPATLLVPDDAHGELVLWLTHLGGSAERESPMLERIATLGHPVVTFDPPCHGARSSSGDPWAFAAGVLADFRRRMWPILGQATLEAMRVITWAQAELDSPDAAVRAGGVSMGGDIAVALAGIDDRVVRVATIGSTPDWTRPDMRRLDDADVVVDQGTADRYAQWFADVLDPMRHLDRYARDVVFAFEAGAEDHHIPVAHANAFADALGGERVRVQTYPELDHLGVTTSEDARVAAAAWLTR